MLKKFVFQITIVIFAFAISSCGNIELFDGDKAGVVIDERSPSSERGLVIQSLSNTVDLKNSGTFKVGLNTNPGKDVTVTVSRSKLSGNSTISPAAFILNSSNWVSGYPVTISGVCDTLTDNATYSLSFSTNGGYPSTFQHLDGTFTDSNNVNMERGTKSNGELADNLTGVIYEADKIGVRSSQNFTTESSGNSTLYIKLCKPPTNNVTVALTSTDATEGSLSASSLVFSSGNWSTEVSVNVLGQDDTSGDGDISYNVEVAAVGYTTEIVGLRNIDNETPQVITSDSVIGAIQEGSTGTFTVSLATAPSSNVVLPVSVRDTPSGSSSSQVSVSPNTITFSSGNYSTPQTITLTGTSDSYSEGLVNYYLYLGPPNTVDSNYSRLPAKVLMGQIYD